jgi:transcriptional antiterminator NusG
MVEPATAPVAIKEGDIVEILSESFKKEKAKVLRVDEQKGDVVVSLLGALVQIPVTIKIDNVRAISRDEQEEED